jgi:L-fuconolactonase
MIVDAHQHFWDPARATYEWMSDDLAALRRRFEPVDLEPLLTACGVARTVAVQARSTVDDTVYLLGLAAANQSVAGVVGWVDLTAPRVDVTLAELAAMPGGAKLVGIRHQVHDEPDPGWLLRDDVRRGLSMVGEAGLVFDLLVRTRELPAAVAMVERHPSVAFVVDHLAKPPLAGRDDGEWRRWVERMSAFPNVSVKLSGLVTEADWESWTPDDLSPYVESALSWFGDERLLFGSDWPVCTLAATYGEAFATYRAIVEDLAANSVERIFGSNAVRIYGLGAPRPAVAG